MTTLLGRFFAFCTLHAGKKVEPKSKFAEISREEQSEREKHIISDITEIHITDLEENVP
jgi:hypothetical protein